MTEHGGPSRLAELAREITQPHAATYPVKIRGQRRRLNPNRDGIDWLEGEAFRLATEIAPETTADPTDADNGLYGIMAYGAWTAADGHVRRMFDLHPATAFSGMPTAYLSPCPACLDFSRSWHCPDHRELTWDTGLRHRGRPGGTCTVTITVHDNAGHRIQFEADAR